eukprot:8876118-Alexandrium_andersonii.AAC.1
MAVNRGRAREEERCRRGAEARVLLEFACEGRSSQLAGGRCILRGRPTGARPRQEPPAVRLLVDARAGSVVGHQSQYGQ